MCVCVCVCTRVRAFLQKLKAAIEELEKTKNQVTISPTVPSDWSNARDRQLRDELDVARTALGDAQREAREHKAHADKSERTLKKLEDKQVSNALTSRENTYTRWSLAKASVTEQASHAKDALARAEKEHKGSRFAAFAPSRRPTLAVRDALSRRASLQRAKKSSRSTTSR